MYRYDIVAFTGQSDEPKLAVKEQPDGKWVRYSDVKKLESRVRELEEQLANKVKIIDEMAERHTYGDVYERRSLKGGA